MIEKDNLDSSLILYRLTLHFNFFCFLLLRSHLNGSHHFETGMIRRKSVMKVRRTCDAFPFKALYNPMPNYSMALVKGKEILKVHLNPIKVLQDFEKALPDNA